LLIRTLSALQDRSSLALRILLYYLAVSVVGLAAEHYLIDALLGRDNYWTKLTIDTAFRAGVGLVLFLFAAKLIRAQERNRAISMESTLQLLGKLALASEYRDDVTAAHNSRIGAYCALVAQELGLEEEQQEILSYAASLHDIGKVAIPDNILRKPGPLTSDERELMQKHVLFGADLLFGGGHPMMDEAYNIALTHHESWDGKGYPNGLSGAQIPLCGRIVGLCDTFDALISERPYKEAWPVEEAAIEILRQSGKRFDPIVVNAFCRALPKIKELQHRPTTSKTIREAASYLPVEAVARLEPSRWYPNEISIAQAQNEAALSQMLLSGGEPHYIK
jgi:HD-GYP domain-containing protein (c-di-GMP phosphodiesterase class II)